ncbi:Ig-like domain-containing protein [Pseudomonas sp. S2_B10]
MSVQVYSTEANAALALYPVYPPQWITPVLPPGTADGGLPLSAFTPSGVELVIDPITGLRNWVMAAYDVVTIFVNGVNTGISKTIYPGEEQERILLRVPASWFTNGVNDVHYRVTRASGNDADSPTLKLLYNNPAPTVTVSHPPSVAPGQTAVITITVGYSRPQDTVTLTIGTWSITFANPTSPINHTLTAAELQLIGDGTHSVFARVRDQLTNNNESATTPITITANQKVYNSPIIAEAVDGMLDVAALRGQDATLRARNWTGIQVGQQVWLKLTGQKPDGSAHVLQFWNGDTHKVNATWVSQGFWDKPLLIAFLKELKEGSLLKLEFWVSEDKSNDFASATRFPDQVYTVIGLQLDLPPPTLNPPTVPIDVLANPDGVKLQITGFAAEKDDKAQFVQVNAPAGAPPFPVVDFVGGIAEISLSAAFLAAWHGKAIELRWDLIRTGVPAGESPTVRFDVMTIADGDPRLPTPVILQAIGPDEGKVLDLSTFDGDATVTVDTWTAMAKGQKFWLLCVGKKDDGSDYEISLANGIEIEMPGKLSRTLLRSELDRLVDGSLRVDISVGFSTNGDKNDATLFPSLNVGLKVRAKLIIDDSPLELSGRTVSIVNTSGQYIDRWRLTGVHPSGASANRQASGGVGQITYQSDNPKIANVNDVGLIWSEGNGSTTINVRDSSGQHASISVSVSNVEQCIVSPSLIADSKIDQWVNANGRAVKTSDLVLFRTKFFVTQPAAYGIRSDVSLYWGLYNEGHGWREHAYHSSPGHTVLCLR